MEYRADHVGSLLRPPELLKARDEHTQGLLTTEALREVEDACILRALRMQEEAGLDVLSDGEYRRGGWSEAWVQSIEGLVPAELPPEAALPTAWQGGYLAEEQESSPRPVEAAARRLVVQDKIRQSRRLAAHESAFLAGRAAELSRPFKITMPGAMMFATSAFMPGVSDRVYATRSEMTLDLVAMMRDEIGSLVAEGVRYIQLDSLRYVMPLADPDLRRKMIEAGQDPEALLDETIDCDNACLEGVDRDGVTIALHMCRGNNRSAWAASGPYDFIAEKAFSRLDIDRLLLEYDDERSGSFEALKFVPKDRTVVLGLVSTKQPDLENVDELCRRIEDASRYHPLEKLALSPQCGFASMAPGNLLGWEDQVRKLELVARVARKVWG